MASASWKNLSSGKMTPQSKAMAFSLEKVVVLGRGGTQGNLQVGARRFRRRRAVVHRVLRTRGDGAPAGFETGHAGSLTGAPFLRTDRSLSRSPRAAGYCCFLGAALRGALPGAGLALLGAGLAAGLDFSLPPIRVKASSALKGKCRIDV